MIAWLALLLGLVNLGVWALLALAARKLWRQYGPLVSPLVSMLGLGAPAAAAPAEGAGPVVPPVTPVPPAPCDAPEHFRCPTPDYCSREGCQF